MAKAVESTQFVGLVNNAGIGYRQSVGGLDMARVKSLFDVNVFGVIDVMQTFAPLFTQGSRVVSSPHPLTQAW